MTTSKLAALRASFESNPTSTHLRELLGEDYPHRNADLAAAARRLDVEPLIRIRALDAITRSRQPAVVDEVRPLLEDACPAVRRTALRALARIGSCLSDIPRGGPEHTWARAVVAARHGLDLELPGTHTRKASFPESAVVRTASEIDLNDVAPALFDATTCLPDKKFVARLDWPDSPSWALTVDTRAFERAVPGALLILGSLAEETIPDEGKFFLQGFILARRTDTTLEAAVVNPGETASLFGTASLEADRLRVVLSPTTSDDALLLRLSFAVGADGLHDVEAARSSAVEKTLPRASL